MSRAVASLVLKRRFGSTVRKSVALVLADHADGDEWSTIVGQPTIASEAEVGERTVRRVLSEFEDEGLVVRERRHRGDGTRTSDRITLVREAIAALPATLASGRRMSRLPATQTATTGQSLAAQEPSEEPSEEPSAAGQPASVATSDLPAVRWAKRWAELRGVVWGPAVERAWAPQVQDFIRAGGEPSESLLAVAISEGIRNPSGWHFVTGSVAEQDAARRADEWMEAR